MTKLHDISQSNSQIEQSTRPEASVQAQVRNSGKGKAHRRRARIACATWSKTEERRYIKFIGKNEPLFRLSPRERKEIKINVMMSQSVKTRTPAQCHSHHQKMTIKYKGIPEIITNLTLNLEKPKLKEEQIQAESSVQSLIGNPEGIDYLEKSRKKAIWWDVLELNSPHQEAEFVAEPESEQLDGFLQH